MAKATLFVLIAVAAGLLVYLLAAPRFAPSNLSVRGPQIHGEAPTQPAATSAESSNAWVPAAPTPSRSTGTSVDTAPVIDVPLTSEQRSAKDLEMRRGPLYAWIRDNMQSVLVGWQPSTADPATLNLYMARADSAAADITLCMNRLVEPYATRYGFNHVSFFVPNPPTESEQRRLDSEATPDENGSWHLYKK